MKLQNSLFSVSLFCCSVLEKSVRDAGMCNARIKGSQTTREEKRDRRFFIQRERIRSDLTGFLSDDSSAYTVNLKHDVTDVAPVWRHV